MYSLKSNRSISLPPSLSFSISINASRVECIIRSPVAAVRRPGSPPVYEWRKRLQGRTLTRARQTVIIIKDSCSGNNMYMSVCMVRCTLYIVQEPKQRLSLSVSLKKNHWPATMWLIFNKSGAKTTTKPHKSPEGRVGEKLCWYAGMLECLGAWVLGCLDAAQQHVDNVITVTIIIKWKCQTGQGEAIAIVSRTRLLPTATRSSLSYAYGFRCSTTLRFHFVFTSILSTFN